MKCHNFLATILVLFVFVCLNNVVYCDGRISVFSRIKKNGNRLISWLKLRKKVIGSKHQNSALKDKTKGLKSHRPHKVYKAKIKKEDTFLNTSKQHLLYPRISKARKKQKRQVSKRVIFME